MDVKCQVIFIIFLFTIVFDCLWIFYFASRLYARNFEIALCDFGSFHSVAIKFLRTAKKQLYLWYGSDFVIL